MGESSHPIHRSICAALWLPFCDHRETAHEAWTHRACLVVVGSAGALTQGLWGKRRAVRTMGRRAPDGGPRCLCHLFCIPHDSGRADDYLWEGGYALLALTSSLKHLLA